MPNVDRCICCGKIIPEGRQICPICENNPCNIKPHKTDIKGVITHVRAQWEIRDLAAKMRDAVLEVMPEAKRFLVPQCEQNTDFPYCTEAKSCGRHPRLKDVYGKEVER